MRLEYESQMFLAAMSFALTSTAHKDHPNWADGHTHFHLPAQPAHVLWPRGTKFMNPSCVVWCSQRATSLRQMLEEFNPVNVKYVQGRAYYFFKEGQNVMARLGAVPALRCKEESQVLR